MICIFWHVFSAAKMEESGICAIDQQPEFKATTPDCISRWGSLPTVEAADSFKVGSACSLSGSVSELTHYSAGRWRLRWSCCRRVFSDRFRCLPSVPQSDNLLKLPTLKPQKFQLHVYFTEILPDLRALLGSKFQPVFQNTNTHR